MTPEFLSQLCLGLLGDLGKCNPSFGPQFPQRCNDTLHLSGSVPEPRRGTLTQVAGPGPEFLGRAHPRRWGCHRCGCIPRILDPQAHVLPSTGDLNETECNRQTCECDKSVVLCFQNQTYNEKHRNYFNVYCQGTTPNCSIYEQPRKKEACRPVSPAPPEHPLGSDREEGWRFHL